MIHADRALAGRLEGLICAEYRRLAEVAHALMPDVSAECLAVAGGVALWLGEGSPVNLAVGLGLNGPVDETEVECLETFYGERGADARVSTCPLADSSLFLALGRRGWRVSEFEHLLVLELGEESPLAGPDARTGGRPDCGSSATYDVRVCPPAERDTWARVAALGFSNGAVPGRGGGEEVGKIMAGREEAVLVLAWVDGKPAGTGALVVDGGVGWLSGDSTLPRYRGHGIQQAVQRHRLKLARDAGCDLAATEAAPGGASHRNMERLGFRIAYTHAEFTTKAWFRGPRGESAR